MVQGIVFIDIKMSESYLVKRRMKILLKRFTYRNKKNVFEKINLKKIKQRSANRCHRSNFHPTFY